VGRVRANTVIILADGEKAEAHAATQASTNIALFIMGLVVGLDLVVPHAKIPPNLSMSEMRLFTTRAIL